MDFRVSKPKQSPTPTFDASDSLKKSIEKQTQVALQITGKIFSNKEFCDKNIVFSPLSIHVILSMLTAGTSGKTQEKNLEFLLAESIEEVNSLAEKVYPLVFSDGSQQGGPLLSFINGVWIDQSLSIKSSFQNAVDNVYKVAAVKQVDFNNKPAKARIIVNSWGEKQTNGLIDDVLPPGSVNSSTKLILANALYFKGEWNR